MFQVAHMSDAEWDTALDATTVWKSGDARVGTWSPHNYSGWAHVKSLDGWECLRVSDLHGNPISQVLTKRRGPVCIAYCPGGFAANQAVDANAFTRFLQTTLGARLIYVRVHCLTPTKFGDAGMQHAGWRTAAATLGARTSLKLRLDSTVEERAEGLSFNWRRNLRRAEKHENDVSIDIVPSAESIAVLHQQLEQLKGMHVNTWESSQPHVERLITGFGARLVVATCTSEQGVLRAIRGVIITGGCAFDILAATSMEGRKHYSSHITLWTLANELAARGIARYDLSGVDPEQNRGVYDFKSGTGAMPITYGGEYDFAIPLPTRWIMSRLATIGRTV
jgi:hypothetical protein